MQAAHILAVDDEPELTELISYHLGRVGHHVATAANGWEALDQIGRQRPDLILLDLMLPDLDGFGVCEILRRDARTATIPIIIISAWASIDSRHLGLELGALDYITKPFSPQELVRRVNHFVEQRADPATN
ncbi:MAG TPA: response regulator [Candidatus Didemnitutus sp.]|nr:response regulator [Candidatus Didemnitutus sp.]